jgi:hypothetical protein
MMLQLNVCHGRKVVYRTQVTRRAHIMMLVIEKIYCIRDHVNIMYRTR